MKSFSKKWMLLALLSMSISLYASHVSVEQARLVADGFLQSETALHNGPKKAPQKTRKAPRMLLPEQQFYIFETDGGGFVIIAADDCAHPVLAYGKKGFAGDAELNPDKMPLNLRNWLEGYNYSIRAAVADGYTAPASVQAEWQALAEGKAVEAVPVVEPLITTEWDQQQEYIDVTNTYNYFTPADVYVYEGQEYPMNAPVGCVATAMAQVMKYWEWPKQGTGSHSYMPIRRPDYGLQSADFGATTYDWSNMPDHLTYLSAKERIQAVALLMYHCGVACDMDYDINGSSAYSVIYSKSAGYSPAEHALCTYFGYSNSLESYFRSDFEKDDEWIRMLKEELNAARPIMYAGRGKDNNSGGHSFVCCGYDSDDRFYFNFGWGGTYDGYFSIDAIQPGGSGTGGNAEHNYSFGQDAIVGIRPAESDSERAYDTALRLYHHDKDDYSPKMTLDSLWYYYDTLEVSFEIANYDSITFKGYLAMQVLDDNGRVMATSDSSWCRIPDFQTMNVTMQILPTLALVPGHYHVQPVFRNSAGGWTTIEAKHYWSKLEFTVYHWAYMCAFSDMTVFPDPLVQGRQVTVNQAFVNWSGATFTGQVYASLYSLDDQWVQDIDYVDFSSYPLNHNTYANLTYSGTITADPGEYVLLITYLNNNSLNLVGSDYYNAAIRVTVLSSSDVPEQETGYLLTVQSFIAQNATTGVRTLYEGDTIGAYVEMANEGLSDYSDEIVLQLLDENNNVIKNAFYKLTLKATSMATGGMQVDTVLNPGNYYLVLYYYDAEAKEFKPFKDGKATYWCYFTVYANEPTGVEDVNTTVVRVYPNPIADVLYVDGAEVGQYSLYNLSGQLLMNRKENGAQQLPMSGVPAGEYILQLVDTQGKISVHRVTKR